MHRPSEGQVYVPKVRVSNLSALLGGEVIGASDLIVERIGSLQSADDTTVSFLSNPRYATQLESTRAGCVIVSPGFRSKVTHLPSAIVCADPYLAYARLTQWWAREHAPVKAASGQHPSAVVDGSAQVHPTARVDALAVIGPGARVGAGAWVGAHAVMEDQAVLGAHSRLGPRVVLGRGCAVGERCILHAGVVIGADGFGFAAHEGRWEKIEQLGAVRIGDDVEIGANTCVDRGALEDTVIEQGVKLDNLIQIGHNVRIGAHTAMAGCVGVAGSARIGAHCTVGGGAIILGHLEVADHVHVSAATVVTRSIVKPGQYSGVYPFEENASWEKNAATLRQLHGLRDRLRALEKART
ncbi:MAG: UDP-3-O-(3-hydroxymyristoyl)glucosamine N-acyltransferase [Rubrivivax sp.]|jgi:UDP-3-O-[3-hydroxymyristoyl] glucosamine N-acyltransferase